MTRAGLFSLGQDKAAAAIGAGDCAIFQRQKDAGVAGIFRAAIAPGFVAIDSDGFGGFHTDYLDEERGKVQWGCLLASVC